jgi:hypothetical protein
MVGLTGSVLCDVRAETDIFYKWGMLCYVLDKSLGWRDRQLSIQN